MLSIASMTNGNGNAFIVKEQKTEYKTTANGTTETVSLESAWSSFAEGLKKKNKINLSSTLSSHKPVQEDEATISFNVLNQVQEDEIDAIRTDLLIFLRSALKNPALQLKIIVDENTTERKPYTGDEKFQRLSEKNPALNKLRQQFGLEIDF